MGPIRLGGNNAEKTLQMQALDTNSFLLSYSCGGFSHVGGAATFHSHKALLWMEHAEETKGHPKVENTEKVKVLWQNRPKADQVFFFLRKHQKKCDYPQLSQSFHILLRNSCNKTESTLTHGLWDSVSSIYGLCTVFICPTSQSSKIFIERIQ